MVVGDAVMITMAAVGTGVTGREVGKNVGTVVATNAVGESVVSGRVGADVVNSGDGVGALTAKGGPVGSLDGAGVGMDVIFTAAHFVVS